MKLLKLKTIAILTIVVILFCSCIKKEYDINNLDLTMKLGGDSLFLPVGSTDTIRLGQFIDTANIDVLTLLADNVYSIEVKGDAHLDIPNIDASQLTLQNICDSMRKKMVLFDSTVVGNFTLPAMSHNFLSPLGVPLIDVANLSIPPFYFTTSYPLGLNTLPKPPIPVTIPIPTIPISQEMTTPIQIVFELPSQINSVDTVLFSSSTHLNVTISKSNFPAGLNTTLDSIVIAFPPELTIVNSSNVTNNTYTLKNVIIGDMPTIVSVGIQSLILVNAPIVNDSINYSSNISVKFATSISGNVNSGDLPSDAQSDARLNLTLNSSFNINSVSVNIAPITNIPELQYSMPLNISTYLDLSTLGIDSIGDVDVTNTDAVFTFNFPYISDEVMIKTGSDGFVMKFPQMFQFTPTPGLDIATNTYTITPGSIMPPSISFTLETFKINKKIVNNTLNISDSVSVHANFVITGGKINSSQIATLANQNIGASVFVPSIELTDISIGSVATEYKDSVTFQYIIEDIPDFIIRIDSLLLDNTEINLSVTLDPSQLGLINTPIIADIVIDLPDFITFKQGEVSPGNILHRQVIFSKSNPTFDLVLHVDGFSTDQISIINHKIEFNEIIKLQGAVKIVNPELDLSAIHNSEAEVSVIFEVKNVALKKIAGIVDPQIDAQKLSIDLSQIPGMIRDNAILDILNPIAKIRTLSNIGIPLVAKIAFIPYKNGSIIADAVDTLNILFNPSGNPAVSIENNYWIANTMDYVEDGYTFLGLNLPQIIRHMPDSLQISIIPSINTDIAGQYEIDANYYADVDYELLVPINLGPQFKVSYNDTFAFTDPDVLEMIFQGAEIGLIGYFANTIPLDIEATIIPLDGDNNPIPLNNYPYINIESCGNNYAETITEYDVSINDPDKNMKHCRKLVINLRITTENVPTGLGLKPSNYVRATMKAKMLGGIIIDLKDIKNMGGNN
ncbi:hypothetical protein FACS1894153_1600 [Bacteroidia bacterium]|nr:hypothetical protein FACS1894153_1600 [Bacteroidia bacterium]